MGKQRSGNAEEKPTETKAAKPKLSLRLPGQTPLRGVRDLWQLPALLAGIALLAAGVAVWVRSAPGPDFQGAFEDVRVLIERGAYPEALERLNGPILKEIEGPAVTEAIRGEFHALRGDALYLSHRSTEGHSPELARANNEKTLDEYHHAEEFDEAQIDGRRRGFIAETLFDLGRLEEAAEETLHLGEEQGDRRRSLLRRLIERRLAGGANGRDHAQELLEALTTDITSTEMDRLWVAARRAELHLDEGLHDRAIDDLLVEIQRLERRDLREAGELFLLLGRAYLEQGQIEPARTQLLRAEGVFLPGDALRGQVDVLLARIAQIQGDVEEARDRFASTAERFPGSAAAVLSYLGLGETESDLGRFEESVQAYAALVELMHDDRTPSSLSEDAVVQSLMQRVRIREVEGDLDSALAYAQLAEQVHAGSRPPPETTLRVAELHLARAERAFGETSGELDRAVEELGKDPARLEEARKAFVLAGQAFERHASSVMVDDAMRGGQSIYQAADCFDRAGDQDQAIRLFTDFVQSRRDDPKQLDAKYRLARCFQARGEYKTAVGLFEEISRTSPGSDEAYRSAVPLAQAYLAASDDQDADKAERKLLTVLDGRTFEPSSPEFRRALIELGRMYLRLGRYTEAIERLGEALDRYPEHPERRRMEFELAESQRLSAASIDTQMDEAMPLGERATLTTLREQRLRRALELYEGVRLALEAMDESLLTELDQLMWRNATFYRGDCAFDLGEYDTAIKYYDAAAQRYADDPASLVAMVQIVNSYAAQERWREARTAHERARSRLKELPDEAWEAARAPMDRRHWERWLDVSLRLDEEGARAGVGAEGGEGEGPGGAPQN